MVKITKVYTRQGDRGETHLAGGARISKDSLRIQAMGDIDELNAVLGYATSALGSSPILFSLKGMCLRIQNELFNLGSQLAVLPKNRRENTPLLKVENTELLEKEIDWFNKSLPVLSSFILPGGGDISTRFHMARTVCRRAERTLVALSNSDRLDGVELSYINRLSDWLFVVARYITHQLNQEELLWISRSR